MIGVLKTPDSDLRFDLPAHLTHEAFDRLLMWATDEGCSDVRLEANKRVVVQRHGRVIRLPSRKLTLPEIDDAASWVWGADAGAHFKTKRDFNLAYEPGRNRDVRYRYRVNASWAMQYGVDGPAKVIRSLPTTPVGLERQHVEQDILDNYLPPNGMVIVAGATGEGKSTLLAGMVLEVLRRPDSHRTVLEYSAPIEYVFDGFSGPTAEITQIEIGRHLETFAAGVRHAVRSNANIIVVGECRDSETMAAAIDASLANHLVFLTVHAGSVYDTFARIKSLCPPERRSELTGALAQAVRLVVNQRLVWSTDGTRTPIREWMVCDRKTRTLLNENDPDKWAGIMQAMAEARKTDFEESIHRALREGRITETTALKHIRELRV